MYIIVQVLNEFASVAARKLGMSWVEIQEILSQARAVCPVEPITVEVHDCGLRLAERYGLPVYDAMIVASALIAGCTTLYSEDMQDGQVIDDQLALRFAPGETVLRSGGTRSPFARDDFLTSSHTFPLVARKVSR